MKKLAILCFLLAGSVSNAQTWNKDFDKALEQAAAGDKLLLLLFSVPDDCERCGELERKVFASPEFAAYAAPNFVLAKPDFTPRASFETKAANLLIVEKYNKDGFFPLVVILDTSSKVLGKIGIYNGETPLQYIQLLKSIAKR